MIHQISFKPNSKSHVDDAIGICTNIKQLCEKAEWFGDVIDESGIDFECAFMNGRWVPGSTVYHQRR